MSMKNLMLCTILSIYIIYLLSLFCLDLSDVIFYYKQLFRLLLGYAGVSKSLMTYFFSSTLEKTPNER